MMEGLISHYGYWAVLIGTFLEGETVLVLGGFAAHQGYLSLSWVILAAFAGSFSGDQLFFFLGRKYSARILLKRPAWQTQVIRVNKLMDRFRSWLILMFRFMYGLRTVTPFVIGMSPIPRVRFILLNGTGALAWAAAVGTGGYLFGNLLEIFLGKIKHYEIEILAAIVTVGMMVGLFHFLYRRRALSSSSSITKKH
jgi:membrane protein DedA with SNARE-associated domain